MNRVESIVRDFLRELGEDPDRDGLVETPKRVAKAWAERLAGMRMDPASILSKTFDAAGYDEVVALRDISFWSTCEHHLLPFYGTASVAYLPGERVVGLSKLARLVDCFARRLQIQERMTAEIASAIGATLGARGVAVLVRARHLCMCARGVRDPGAEMVTSSMSGVFRDSPSARSEVLALFGP